MKRIKNVRSFVTAIIVLILGGVRSLPKRKGLVGLSTIPPAVCFPEEL